MRFPDKPAATAGLGLACALVLLTVLSWPTLVGSQNATNLVSSPSSAAASSTMSQIATQETLTLTSTVAETTNSNSAYTLNSGFPLVANGSGTNSTANLSPLSTSSTVSSVTQAGTTIVSEISTNPSSQNMFSGLSAATSGLPTGYWIFAILAVISLAIAVSSTFFVRKRVNPEMVYE
ncbi:MAG: hypothetical protein JRN20_01930 [Nitrososphaerota archaeon]|nr:hypothetical protein [Nitrososphaerota archaeon]MDG6922844.1 hypothetical protein [Nitrososphaerota archaeon]